jgi:hypothetical protein
LLERGQLEEAVWDPRTGRRIDTERRADVILTALHACAEWPSSGGLAQAEERVQKLLSLVQQANSRRSFDEAITLGNAGVNGLASIFGSREPGDPALQPLLQRRIQLYEGLVVAYQKTNQPDQARYLQEAIQNFQSQLRNK